MPVYQMSYRCAVHINGRTHYGYPADHKADAITRMRQLNEQYRLAGKPYRVYVEKHRSRITN